MPKLRPIKYDFSAGELTPLLRAATDTTWYARGVAYAKNISLLSQGPFKSRAAIEYWESVIGNSGVIFDFQRSADEAYVVIVSDNDTLTVLNTEDSPISRQLIQNPSFDEDLNSWTAVESGNSSATVTDSVLYLRSHNNGSVYVYQSISDVYENKLHTILVDMLVDDGNIIEVRVGTAPNFDNYLNLSGGGTELSGTFTPNSDAPFYVTLFKAAGTNTTKAVDMVRVFVETTSVVIYSTTHPWNNRQLHRLHAKLPPELDQMFFSQPHTPPYILAVDPTNTWDLLQVSFTPSEPAFWTEKPENYPRTIAFFEGRAWYGGGGERFIASRSRDASGSPRYGDLTTGTQADDAIDYRLDERGSIQWMLGLENLVIGTKTGEHIVTSSGGVIIPGDIDVQQQSAYGSNFCQPLKMGTKVLYVGSNGERVYEIGYRWQEEKWVSRDIFYSAEHLAEDAIIKELIWLQYPNSQLVVVLSNGTSLTCLYDEVRDKIGWSRVVTKNGSILSSCSVVINGISHVVPLISRNRYDDSSNPLLNVEISARTWHEVLDSLKIEFSSLEKDTIDEGQHLANQTVQVIVDGARHPDVTIAADGTATLDWAGNYIVYGLKVETVVTLLDMDVLADGTTLHMKQRWNKVLLRLYESVLPEIIAQGTEVPITLPDRHPSTLMNTKEEPYTGDIQITELGYSSGGFTIRNTEPFVLQVLGIFGELAADQLG